jgi:hypothetical protein
MHTHLRASAAAWIAVTALLTTSSESPAAERLVVRTYNNARVTAAELTEARGVASAILEGARLQTVWRDCATAACDDAPGPRELIVRIVAAPQGIVADSLGCALIDLQDGAGTLATIYSDRINVVAFRTGVNAGTLLGRAVAHEIGHLLLGTARHSASGLMRALWSDRELQRPGRADWTFGPEEVASIAGRFAARPCETCSIMAQITPIWLDQK